MRAILHRRYGPARWLETSDVDVPTPGDGDVLVRVHAASVNAYDWHMMRGEPYLARLTAGLRRPKVSAFGMDAAGVVEAVGHDVTHVRPGDRVFGEARGAFADYVAGRHFVPMPAGLSFEQAATLPMAGITALQGLRDHAKVAAGDRVLVYGAGGGVGTFAVQIAKAYGTHVTAVTRSTGTDLARTLGADEVLDYAREDFTRRNEIYDVIVDIAGNRSLAELRRPLTSDGRLVLFAPAPGNWAGPIVRIVAATARSLISRQTLRTFLATTNRDELSALAELVAEGKVSPVVGATYPFDKIPDAIDHVESGRARGKVVITVSE